MTPQDVFVGLVGIALGIAAFLAAVCNWDGAYRLWAARFVEKRTNRTGARIFYAILGIVLIAIGCLVMTG